MGWKKPHNHTGSELDWVPLFFTTQASCVCVYEHVGGTPKGTLLQFVSLLSIPRAFV